MTTTIVLIILILLLFMFVAVSSLLLLLVKGSYGTLEKEIEFRKFKEEVQVSNQDTDETEPPRSDT